MVASFGGGERLTDSVAVAQLAQQNDVGIFTQRGAQPEAERGAVRADFALLDQRLPALVNELDGIFQRNNVLRLLAVNGVDHRGKRSRFAAAGRAGHQ